MNKAKTHKINPLALKPTQSIFRRIVAAVLLGLLVAGLVLLGANGGISPGFTIWAVSLFFVTGFGFFFTYELPVSWKKARTAVYTVLCAFTSFVTNEMLARNKIENLRTGAVFATVLFIFAAYLLFYAITGRLSTAITISGSILIALGLVSYFVMLYRGTPFVLPGDLYAIGTAASVAGSYKVSFDSLFLLTVFHFLCMYILSGMTELPRFTGRPGVAVRLSCGVGAVVLFLLLCTQPLLDVLGVTPNRYAQKESMRQNGVLMYTLTEMAHSSVQKPPGYGEEILDALVGQYPSDYVPESAQKPNVVLILSESWSDVHRSANLETNQEVTPYLDEFRQREDVVSGELIVPVFGGVTVSTEFESLTGNAISFSLSSAVYFQYISKQDTPSIATTLNALVYTSTAVHPFLETGWGRDKAYPNMGFSDFITIEDMGDVKYQRYYADDQVSFDTILSVLEGDDDPSFVLCITMQNHGSYNDPNYVGDIRLENQSESLPLTEQYLSSLHESDREFERLVEGIEALDEPTIVLMYGDHLPMLGDEYEKFDSPVPADFMHRTPFVMFANYDAPFSGGEAGLMSSNYITPYLLDKAGLPLTGYYKFLLDLKAVYPVFAISYDTLGDESYSGSLRLDDPLVNDYRILQYNNIFGGEGRRDELFYLWE